MAPTLSVRLRSATQQAHERLEASLPLLDGHPSQATFTAALRGFHGFHLVWEEGIAEQADLAAVFSGRSRLPHLAHDLAALGHSPETLEALPRCPQARDLTRDADTALGSLYVLEGSTLGGRLIARALAEADWTPPGGLRYFSPYGAATGARWRELQAVLDATPAARSRTIVDGALQTFAVLRDWMEQAMGDVSADHRRPVVA